MIDLYNGDCLEVMKDIPDKSVDLVLIDPPYNINKAKWDKWKTVEDYVNFLGSAFLECQRVLKDNGSFYFFHNDFLQMVELQNWINKNTSFVFKNLIVWDKGDFRAINWKNCKDSNTLRSWFPTCEYCLYYTFSDGTGLERIMLDVNNFESLKKYFYEVLCYLGKNVKDVNRELHSRKAEHVFYVMPKKYIIDKIGGKADHCLRYGSTQWDLCTKETYDQITEVFDLDKWEKFRTYEDLKNEYLELRQQYEGLRQGYESQRYTHNLDERHNNIWKSKEHNTSKYHPCEKPQDILQRIIKTSSNENDTVLDCFMGSGSTGVACKNTNRNFIGIELDTEYFEIAKNRIEK